MSRPRAIRGSRVGSWPSRTHRGHSWIVLGVCLVVTLMSGQKTAALGCCVADGWVEGELLVQFEEGTPLRRVLEIADELGAVILDDMILEIYLMGVPPQEELAYIELFEAYAEVVNAGVNRVGCIPEDPYCECCPLGIVCAELPDCTRTPATLLVGKAPGPAGVLTMYWTPDCGLAFSYAVYEGTLGEFYDHVPKVCFDDGERLVEEIVPVAGDTYYIVVPYDGPIEGSHGRDSSLVERPRPGSTCWPEQSVEHCSN